MKSAPKKKPVRRRRASAVELPSERQLEAGLATAGVEEDSVAYAAVDDIFYYSRQERLALVFLAATDDDGGDSALRQLREASQKLHERWERRRRRSATEIQRRARGLRGRRKAGLMVDHSAATVLQCVYRMLTAKYATAQIRRRQAAARLHCAATAIQRTWRGMLGRQRAAIRREEVWAEIECESATLLQLAWRRRQAQQFEAARAVQAGWRGQQGRRLAERRREQVAVVREQFSVRLLQRCCRGWAARRVAAGLRGQREVQRGQAASVLQALFLAAATRQWWLRLRNGRDATVTTGAARRIQRCCRHRWQVQLDAVILVQASVKKWMRLRRRRVAAAVRVEAAWRCRSAQSAWRAHQLGVSALQRMWRGRHGRQRAAEAAHKFASIRRIQRLWRRHLNTKAHAALCVQAGWRARGGRQRATLLRARAQRRRLRQEQKAERAEVFRRQALEALNVFGEAPYEHRELSQRHETDGSGHVGSARTRSLAMAALGTYVPNSAGEYAAMGHRPQPESYDWRRATRSREDRDTPQQQLQKSTSKRRAASVPLLSGPAEERPSAGNQSTFLPDIRTGEVLAEASGHFRMEAIQALGFRQ